MRKYIRLLFVLIFLLCLPSFAFAAGTCGSGGKTGTSPYVADGLTYAHVNGCVSAVEAGSTIILPAGSGSWGSSTVSISKALTIQGQGTTVSQGPGTITTSISGSSILFNLSVSAANFVTLKNMNLTSTIENDGAGMIDIDGTAMSFGFRITNLNMSAGQFNVYVHSPYGLMDHCRVTNTAWGQLTRFAGESATSGADYWNAVLDLTTRSGTDMAYIEDNIFDGYSGGDGVDDPMDTYGGYVRAVRNNTFISCGPGGHGSDTGGHRASGWFESYNNTIDCSLDTTYGQCYTAQYRGGTGVVYDNTPVGSNFNADIWVDYHRICTSESWGVCGSANYKMDTSYQGVVTSGGYFACTTDLDAWGSSGACSGGGTYSAYFDQSLDACRDTIGRGPRQTLMPLYVWNNGTHGDIGDQDRCANQTAHVLANRDFFEYKSSSWNCTDGVGRGALTLAQLNSTYTSGCAAKDAYWSTTDNTLYQYNSGVWSAYYVPYSYPHALQGGGDTTAPTVTITTTDPSNITTDSLYVYGTSEDIVGVTACKWRIGAAPNASSGVTTTNTTSWNATASGFSQGANTLYVGCTDAAGNWGSDSMVVNLDSVAPTVTITSPTSSPTYGTSSTPLTVGGTSSSDTSTVTYSNAAGGSGSCTGTSSWSCTGVVLTSGSNAITITGTDAFGNPGTDLITVTYTPPDVTPPSVTITTTDPTNTSFSTTSVAWTATDAVGVTSCKWRLGSAPDAFNGTTDGSSPATISGYAIGANTVYIGCTDLAGNWGSDSMVINYAPPGGGGCTVQGGVVQ